MTTLSERTLEIIKAHVADIILVSEDEIKAALRLVYERMKIIIEPSCAVPLAAVLKNADLFKGKKVGIIDLTKGELGTRGTTSQRLKEAQKNLIGIQ